jgi:tetratricopeptide (TPR) repeat protein
MRRLYDRLIGYAPGRMAYRIEFIRQLLEVGQVEEAARRSSEIELQALAPVQRAQVLHLRGDVAWHRNRFEEAASHYQTCLETGLPLGFRRLVQAKRAALSDVGEASRSLLYEYFLGEPPGSVAMYYPMAWAQKAPDAPLAQYLVGRRLWQGRAFDEAVPHLEASAPKLGSRELRWEARWLLGRSLFRTGQWTEAQRVFGQLEASDSPVYRLRASEWSVRIDWLRETGRAGRTGNRETSP